ncbi:PREDICTED: rapid alkalinization factor [Ipomoea nil]|uniref:rapid alkalinization factor n=1 Tax=Ipomoea nil TaxID=35883 RepID=UPI0009014351|nr:PREDICTED: rapid alkalinization factor [Ipomoea nil]
MAFSSLSFLSLILCVTVMLSPYWASATASGDGELVSWMMAAGSGGRCDGSTAECLAEAEELEMESESSRRILATTRYISYGALQKNNIPCSRRGASYYNCRPGAQANPYTRGCSAITRCRG